MNSSGGERRGTARRRGRCGASRTGCSRGIRRRSCPTLRRRTGRRSWKKTSKALEVHHRGVGLHLPEVRVHGRRSATAPGVTAYFRSSRRRCRRIGVALQRVAWSGSGCVCTCADRVGHEFEPLVRARRRDTPVRSPNDDTQPSAPREMSGHMLVSFRRATLRATANPRRPSPPALKRSCDSGIRNSARQPFGVACHRHVPHRVPAVVLVAVVEVIGCRA